MAEVAQGTPILLSVLSFIGVLVLFVIISFFSSRRKKGMENAISERAKLEGKTLVTSEEAMGDVVSMATALASSVDALGDERAKLNSTDVSSPNYRHIHDNITHLEDSIQRGTENLDKALGTSTKVSPEQLAKVRSILISLGSEIKIERYSSLKTLSSNP